MIRHKTMLNELIQKYINALICIIKSKKLYCAYKTANYMNFENLSLDIYFFNNVNIYFPTKLYFILDNFNW